MKSEADIYSRELAKIQKRIENLETKKDYSNTSYQLECILTELRVLREIEDFIWKKL